MLPLLCVVSVVVHVGSACRGLDRGGRKVGGADARLDRTAKDLGLSDRAADPAWSGHHDRSCLERRCPRSQLSRSVAGGSGRRADRYLHRFEEGIRVTAQQVWSHRRRSLGKGCPVSGGGPSLRRRVARCSRDERQPKVSAMSLATQYRRTVINWLTSARRRRRTGSLSSGRRRWRIVSSRGSMAAH